MGFASAKEFQAALDKANRVAKTNKAKAEDAPKPKRKRKAKKSE